MKPYGAIYKRKRQYLSFVILLLSIIYVTYSSYIGIKTALTKQICLFLTEQIQQAQQCVFHPESEHVLVRLRRDQNENITAVTVDGIMLNQLQIEYQKALTKNHFCSVHLSVADILGSKLLFWLPGKWQISCHLETTWRTAIKTRTLEQINGVKVFQLILTTECNAAWYEFFHTAICEDVLLYETVIYTPTR